MDRRSADYSYRDYRHCTVYIRLLQRVSFIRLPVILPRFRAPASRRLQKSHCVCASLPFRSSIAATRGRSWSARRKRVYFAASTFMTFVSFVSSSHLYRAIPTTVDLIFPARLVRSEFHGRSHVFDNFRCRATNVFETGTCGSIRSQVPRSN